MKCRIILTVKNKKTMTSLSSAKLAQRVVKFKRTSEFISNATTDQPTNINYTADFIKVRPMTKCECR